ncbi:ABC transporter permease subunit [Roseomonas frigidaquae]|uniref:ABC transporter permease subunit n=1 Tax=Falsiroseomonas frigidaquae TaxID=487318 RepID=A0ABX1F856_9PROT|nr:ABC transporter permease subunit [Falsiroseomonas frigidaquae]NKE48409.1 ABC transporter permease subunit [Falsiroseomonas frigidaquae]
MTPALRRRLVLALPWAWMALFFVVPFAFVLTIAFAEPAEGLPPYAPLLRWSGEATAVLQLNLANFQLLLDDPYYLDAYLRSLRVAAISATLCLLIGYPMALAIARAPEHRRNLLLMLVILPFWTSFLLRVTAWIGILQDQGWLNGALLALGLIDQPIPLLYTDVAMYIGITYCYLPFMVLPLYATLSKLDPSLLEAAEDLGAPPWRAFLQVTLPLSLPGIVAGFLLVFIPAVGEFVIPELLGGPGAQLIGRVLWTEFFQNRDWPLASALAIVLLAALVAPIALFQWRAGR